MARLGSAEDRGYFEKRAFARVLMALREERGMTQETLAFESGYHPKYISLLERRKHTPSLTASIMVSTALEKDPTETFNKIRARMPRFKRLEGKDHEAADL